jgi:hypothetical protein
VRRVDIFNLNATPSPEEMLLLRNLAETGSILSTFTRAADRKAEEEEAEWADQIAMMMIQMATEEQVRQFHERLDDLEARRLRLLEGIDEELEQARAERQRLYDEAVAVVFPDGTVRKVFRDGDQVRDENGDLVDQEIARAEDVSNNPRQWSENVASGDLVRKLEEQRARVDAMGDDMRDAGTQADAGRYSAGDLDDRLTEFDDLLAAEERSLAADLPHATAPARGLTESGLQTDIVPMRAFAEAVTGPWPDVPFEEDFTLSNPSPSAPAPG